MAFRYLLGRSSKGSRYLLGAVAGIALSLIPIMATLIVTDGMIRGITDRFLELGTGHIQIRPYRLNVDSKSILELDTEIISPLVQNIDEVRGVWSEIQGIGIILGKKGKTGTTIRAVSPSFWEDKESRRYFSVISGEAKIEESRDILIGVELAKTLGAEVGKTLRIMTVRTMSGGKNIPKTRAFTVRGIVSSGYHEIDSMWCIMSFEAGKEFLESETTVPFLLVKINDPYTKVDEVAAILNSELGGFFYAWTWKNLQPLQYSSYEQTRQILLFIMALIVLIAAVNVSSAVSMLVIERHRDIAVLKAFGTSSRDTTLIFVFSGFLTGLLGAVIGISAGLLFGVHINEIIHALEKFINLWTALFNMNAVRILDPGFYLEVIPIIINWQTVCSIGIFTIASSMTASLIPARRAGKTKPVDLLRKY